MVILVEFRGEADDRESEEPREENGRCKGSGIVIERAGELDLINGADVGAIWCEVEAARRGDLDFAPIPNMLIDENKGAPEEEGDLERPVYGSGIVRAGTGGDEVLLFPCGARWDVADVRREDVYWFTRSSFWE